MEREEVITELRRVASLLGKKTLAQREFNRHGKVALNSVKRTFGSWSKAIEAAVLETGLNPYPKLSDDQLAAEFSRVQELLGKVPSGNEFEANGQFSVKPYKDRFGRWSKAVEHYARTVATTSQAKTNYLGPTVHTKPIIEKVQELTSAVGKRVFGPPLDFRNLRHEPVNEQGVVLLFGMIARDLGFLVEAIATGYPDCSAKRKVRGGYITVNIEFEFKSGNFREHGHEPSQCDLIVCWEHDWPECPVEVLELKSKLRELDSRE